MSIEKEVADLLTERGFTLAVAESCTGGLLSKRLTDVPGASKYFLGSIVSYSIHAKTSLLGVDPGLIKEKGAVSREVALAMADCARERFRADIGLGITGIAGPESDASGQEAGTVFVALATKAAAFCENLYPPGKTVGSDRDQIRFDATSHALDMVREILTGPVKVDIQ